MTSGRCVIYFVERGVADAEIKFADCQSRTASTQQLLHLRVPGTSTRRPARSGCCHHREICPIAPENAPCYPRSQADAQAGVTSKQELEQQQDEKAPLQSTTSARTRAFCSALQARRGSPGRRTTKRAKLQEREHRSNARVSTVQTSYRGLW